MRSNNGEGNEKHKTVAVYDVKELQNIEDLRSSRIIGEGGDGVSREMVSWVCAGQGKNKM